VDSVYVKFVGYIYNTSKRYRVSFIFDIRALLHMQYAGIIMLYHITKIHLPESNGFIRYHQTKAKKSFLSRSLTILHYRGY